MRAYVFDHPLTGPVIVQLSGHSTWIFTIVWTVGWTMSAWLFGRAARDR